jgi:hypothetical protein
MGSGEEPGTDVFETPEKRKLYQVKVGGGSTSFVIAREGEGSQSTQYSPSPVLPPRVLLPIAPTTVYYIQYSR